MGYDIVQVPIKCPFCGAITTDGQTNGLANALNIYREGDDVSEHLQHGWIKCVFECQSQKCKGIKGIKGKKFIIRLQIKDAKITKNYMIIEPLQQYNPSKRFTDEPSIL